MEVKHWVIGGLSLAGVVGLVFLMISVNVGNAITQCENAGYDTTEKSGITVTSCTADQDYAHDSIALVVANVSGSPKPILTDEAEKYIRNSLANSVKDINPYIYSTTPGGQQINADFKKPKKAGNVTAFIRSSSKKIETINKAISQPATEDGSDYLNNIVTAARAVQTSPSTESPLVLVIGSGLSDTQPLNFANSDLLHADPKQIANDLIASSGILPNELSGVKIVWSGLGITASPQQPLDAKEKRNLNNIYQEIFRKSGATFVVDDTVMASEGVDTDYKVTPISVNGLKGGLVTYRLGENAIGFKPGTSKIIDTNKANTALEGVITNYQNCRNAKITVEGYQAKLEGASVEETTPISQQRADEVKRLLIGQGVEESQISAVGRGSSDFEGRVKEENAEGKWDDARAQSNRIVLITMKNSGVCN